MLVLDFRQFWEMLGSMHAATANKCPWKLCFVLNLLKIKQ